MKKIIIASIAGLAAAFVASILISRNRNKIIHLDQNLLTKRIGNEKKHLTNVFSKAKKDVMQDIETDIN